MIPDYLTMKILRSGNIKPEVNEKGKSSMIQATQNVTDQAELSNLGVTQ